MADGPPQNAGTFSADAGRRVPRAGAAALVPPLPAKSAISQGPSATFREIFLKYTDIQRKFALIGGRIPRQSGVPGCACRFLYRPADSCLSGDFALWRNPLFDRDSHMRLPVRPGSCAGGGGRRKERRLPRRRIGRQAPGKMKKIDFWRRRTWQMRDWSASPNC